MGFALRNEKGLNPKHEMRAKHPTGINPKQYPMTKIQMIQTIVVPA